jgi:hypothetical protein
MLLMPSGMPSCDTMTPGKKPTRRTHEHFLNLIRLSVLSMPTYTLRTVNPIFRERYTEAATL